VRAPTLCRRPLPFALFFIGHPVGRFRSRTVVDWFSRRVLAWRLSITMEAAFCVEALEEALSRYGDRACPAAETAARAVPSRSIAIRAPVYPTARGQLRSVRRLLWPRVNPSGGGAQPGRPPMVELSAVNPSFTHSS